MTPYLLMSSFTSLYDAYPILGM